MKFIAVSSMGMAVVGTLLSSSSSYRVHAFAFSGPMSTQRTMTTTTITTMNPSKKQNSMRLVTSRSVLSDQVRVSACAYIVVSLRYVFPPPSILTFCCCVVLYYGVFVLLTTGQIRRIDIGRRRYSIWEWTRRSSASLSESSSTQGSEWKYFGRQDDGTHRHDRH